MIFEIVFNEFFSLKIYYPLFKDYFDEELLKIIV